MSADPCVHVTLNGVDLWVRQSTLDKGWGPLMLEPDHDETNDLSYAHLYRSGGISRFGRVIGRQSDFVVVDTPEIEVERARLVERLRHHAVELTAIPGIPPEGEIVADILDAARLLSAEPRPDLLEALRKLVQETVDDHADSQSPFYNDCCGPDLCDWCVDAIATIARLREQQPEPVAWLVETRKPGGIWGALPPVGTEEEAQRLASHGPLLGFESRITPLAPCGPAETVG